MRSLVKHAALAVAVIVGMSGLGTAQATTFETTVAGLKLVLLDKYSQGKAKAVYVAKDAGVGSHGAAGDPPGLTGTVEIFPLSDPSNRAVYTLPADWKVNKTNVAKYVNKLAAPGALGAKVTVQKPTLVQKTVAKNLGDGDSSSGDQSATDLNLQTITTSDTIRVVLTIVNANDGNTYVSCSDFSSPSIKLDNASQPFKLLSKTSSAPGSCSGGSPSPAFLDTSAALFD